MAKKIHSDFIDIRSVFAQYISKWYLFVISVIGCLLLGMVYCRIHQIKYGVRANVLIKQDNASPLPSLGGLGDLFGSSGYVDDEIFVISSHSLYRDVIRDLGLNRTHWVRTGFLKKELAYPNYPIDVYPAEGITDTLRANIAFRVEIDDNQLASVKIKAKGNTLLNEDNVKLPHTFTTEYGDFTVDRTEYYPEGQDVTSTIVVTGYHAAAEEFALEITSEIANKRTNVIELGYNTPNSKMGEALLNEIINKYNERGILENNIQSKKTAEFIDQRLALLSADLSEAEGSIQQFKERNGLIDVEAEAKYQTERRGELDGQLVAAETQLEIIKMVREFIADPANRYELIPTTIDSEAVKRIISEYNSMLIERNDMLQTVSESNQAVVKLTSRVDAMRNNIAKTVQQYYDNTAVTVADLRRQLGSTGSRLGGIPGQERAAMDLERQRAIKQELYIFLRQRQEENAMMMANATPKGLVVDPPYTLKKPIGMGNLTILVLMFIMGLFLPPVYLYIRKVVRNRVESRDEVERHTAAPILGEMCTSTHGGHLLVSPTDTSSATELFRLMRANMLFIFNEANDKVALITSSRSGEGKTFISINLAASLALLNKKVILVGMDIRAPKIASYMDIHTNTGLTQYLANPNVSVDEIITRAPQADIPNLDVIVAGPIPPNPSELLVSRRVEEIFKELRKRYDYIIVDSAPIGMVSDTFALNRIADASILVTRLNVTNMSDLEFIEEIYQDNRLKKLSVVVNGTKSTKVYGYGHAKGSATY